VNSGIKQGVDVACPYRLQPRMGVRRSDIRPSMRMLVESPYLILYRTDPDTDEGSVGIVEVIRVVDGRRDLGGMF
jgi:toxin ParE1/3/4